MVKTFSELKRVVGNFEDMSLLDAKKLFPDAFDSKVDLISKKLNTLRENIVSLDSKKIELNDARQALSDLTVK
jgi:hemerythrin superfamily protein